MNELKVVSIEGQLVTDSRDVAEMIGKRHTDLLRSIDTYNSVLLNAKVRSVDFFIESTYKDLSGKENKSYMLTRKGCDMVANKMTGEKGVLFTAAYVTQFEAMEKEIAAPNSTRAMLLAALEQEERVTKVESRVGQLEDTMRIDGGQEFTLNRMAKAKVIGELGGMNSKAYKTVKRKAFSQFWNEFKRYFKIPRYGDLPKVKMQQAIDFIQEWTPDTALRMEIKQANFQTQLDLAEGTYEATSN